MRPLKITQSITSREGENFNKYLKEVSNLDMISPELEIELAKKIKAGDKRAQDKLITSNLRFVISVAKQYLGRGLEIDDLVSEGNLGLIKAAQKFDETRGVKFISFAVWWIRQSILQAIADNSRVVRLPLNQINLLNKIKSAQSQLEMELGRSVTPFELSEYLEINEDKIELSLKSSQSSTSIDIPFGDDSDFSISDTLQSDIFADTNLFKLDISNRLKSFVSRLSQRDQFIINNIFGLDGSEMTITEISNKLDLTPERIRQIKNSALKKLASITVI